MPFIMNKEFHSARNRRRAIFFFSHPRHRQTRQRATDIYYFKRLLSLFYQQHFTWGVFIHASDEMSISQCDFCLIGNNVFQSEVCHKKFVTASVPR